jgi:hypothetical protein
MVDFRKSLLLAAMALAVGVGTASAQSPGTCAGSTGAPPTLRAEGQAELTGSIVLVCTQVPQGSVNFDLQENAASLAITSRSGGKEATVTVTDPSNGNAVLATVQGVDVALTGGPANDIRFVGVPINIPSPVITISGIRIDATSVGAGPAGFTPVLATVAVSNGALPILQTQGGFFVGIILKAFTQPGQKTNFSLTSCASVVTLPAGVDFDITETEGFPTAYKAQIAAANSDSETGNSHSEANSGTQFGVTFGNIPSGITFYIPVSIFSNSPTGTTLAQLVQNPGGTTVVVNSVSVINGISYIAVASGTTYYYNIEVADPSFTETWDIPVYTPGGNLTGGFSPTVMLELAPQGTLGVEPSVAPSFVSGFGKALTLGASVNNNCQTSLLFPFLTNMAGFDTGISIAATGMDTFGTGVAGGSCVINLFADAAGSPAPSTAPSFTVPAGGENHTTISSIDPGFQGYGIAVCNFTYAHGFAFITDGFGGAGRGLSEGYLPLVITDRPTASSLLGSNPPESLTN